MRTEDLHTTIEDFKKCREFVEDTLNSSSVTSTVVTETMLVFEALFHNLNEQCGSDTGLTLSGRVHMGDVRVTIGFEGKMFDPLDDRDDPFSPENRILRAYADKLGHSYHSGYNKITISVKRSYRRVIMSCFIAMLLAIAVYVPVHFMATDVYTLFLYRDVVFPLERLFTNAILMIGAPVTFLSLINNLTDVYILSERDSGVRKLQGSTIGSSILAVLLAVAAAAVLVNIMTPGKGMLPETPEIAIRTFFSEFILSLMPPSIFEPFVTTSPMPLLILASLFTYAFCSVGKYFDVLKTAVNAGYVLCSRVLSIIMSTLPFFIFASVFDLLLSYGFLGFLQLVVLFIAVCASLVIMIAFYAVRLMIRGVDVKKFAKDLFPLIIENFKINSAIDAVPFNIRYCARTLKIERGKLERFLPVLAQINLDGNCYMLTLVSLLLLFASGTDATPLTIIAIGVLVLFLSLGAPNQPGTCVIGLAIIITYLNTPTLLPLAICAEFLFGGIVNIINVIGDIVTVAGEKTS